MFLDKIFARYSVVTISGLGVGIMLVKCVIFQMIWYFLQQWHVILRIS